MQAEKTDKAFIFFLSQVAIHLHKHPIVVIECLFMCICIYHNGFFVILLLDANYFRCFIICRMIMMSRRRSFFESSIGVEIPETVRATIFKGILVFSYLVIVRLTYVLLPCLHFLLNL